MNRFQWGINYSVNTKMDDGETCFKKGCAKFVVVFVDEMAGCGDSSSLGFPLRFLFVGKNDKQEKTRISRHTSLERNRNPL